MENNFVARFQTTNSFVARFQTTNSFVDCSLLRIRYRVIDWIIRQPASAISYLDQLCKRELVQV